MEQDSAWWKLDLDQVEEGLLRLGWVEKLLDRKKRWHRWSLAAAPIKRRSNIRGSFCSTR